MGKLDRELLPVFVDEPAEYTRLGDHILGVWKGREFHIPIPVAQKIVARLNRVLDACHEERGEIVPLHR